MLTNPKQEHSNELESVVKMVQKSSNKIVDMEKDKVTSLYRNPFNLIQIYIGRKLWRSQGSRGISG